MNQEFESDKELYDNGYYQDKLKQGVEFQDYITEVLYKYGIILVAYSSKHYQNSRGENMLGAEIKRDGKFRETGNLYIEVSEKSDPRNPTYIPSGINRGDNSWLYIIGDEKTIFIFSIKFLKMLENKYQKVIKTTSNGFLLPLEDAKKYSIREIEINQ